jgi:hypothetical protein
VSTQRARAVAPLPWQTQHRRKGARTGRRKRGIWAWPAREGARRPHHARMRDSKVCEALMNMARARRRSALPGPQVKRVGTRNGFPAPVTLLRSGAGGAAALRRRRRRLRRAGRGVGSRSGRLGSRRRRLGAAGGSGDFRLRAGRQHQSCRKRSKSKFDVHRSIPRREAKW